MRTKKLKRCYEKQRKFQGTSVVDWIIYIHAKILLNFLVGIQANSSAWDIFSQKQSFLDNELTCLDLDDYTLSGLVNFLLSQRLGSPLICYNLARSSFTFSTFSRFWIPKRLDSLRFSVDFLHFQNIQGYKLDYKIKLHILDNILFSNCNWLNL